MKHFAIFQGALTPNVTMIVAEIVPQTVTLDGVEHDLHERYHPSLIATMRACPEGTQPGDVYDIITDTYTPQEPVMTAMDDETPPDGEVGNGEPPPKKP